ncbi:Hint domain-containing protein [Pseudoalteromonas sp. DL2-H2.2]|uniref:Hint domain-containing protein n=1 Tax=Pseudoalteromonas sp. DL2-H2.2 TaxID=2908889 RepID=UPI001F420581|nr:Hint domain-containing protein [Pseudoalteromonas sp. DL2-H2.2]MCF2910710.1 Hint domain-containing protein [Pseudoalteromonas sp. DL2-H2.2]
MKLVSLAVIAALGGASLASVASPLSENSTALPKSALEFQTLSSAEKVQQRLSKHGLNKSNRPHLFNLLEKREQAKKFGLKAAQTEQLSSLNNSISANCNADKVCSFFKHMGLRAVKDASGTEYVMISAINSEVASTTYTFIDIALIDENGQDITIPRFAEYYGEGISKKRMDIASLGKLSDIMPRLLAAEQIFADAWVTVVYIDENGNEVAEDKNTVVEYSKETLLAELGYQSALSASQNLKHATASTQAWTEALPSSSMPTIQQGAILESAVTNPVDLKEINADSTLDRIKICLNRKYADCDYDAVYPHGTPNDQLKVLVPFSGFRDVMGKVTKIYRPDWSTKDVTYDANGNPSYAIKPAGTQPMGLYHGTEIFIQTKEGGGASKLGGYQGSEHLFSDHISLKYMQKQVGDNVYDYTRISWNIPRSKGVFGDATLYGRYADAHWIMNLSVEVEQEMRGRKRLRNFTYVVGSTDMPEEQTWTDIDHPPMQMVYSCLAKGSMIMLANGKQLPIEQLQVGDLVLGASQFAPNSHMPLEIKDVSIGVEALPMIKITTDSGKELLLTESHPVVTQSGVSAWANKVQQGDRIHTTNGLELVTKIEQVKYEDNVYNLKLARTSDDPKHITGETFSMFANGLQVGDLAMQSDNEFEDEVETTQDVLNRIPEAWHKDYLNSIQ